MKKIINLPENCVRETAEGFLAAHSTLYEKVPDVAGIRVKKVKDKTALVIGGGMGLMRIHLPCLSATAWRTRRQRAMCLRLQTPGRYCKRRFPSMRERACCSFTAIIPATI